MDNFDLRKFLAESRQVQEKVGTPQYGSTGPTAADIFDPQAQNYTNREGAEKAKEVTLGGTTYKVGSAGNPFKDPNDDGEIINIEKYPNGYFITAAVGHDWATGSSKEGYGYALDFDGNPMDEEDLEGHPHAGVALEGNHMEGETMEEIVAEYVQEALAGNDIKEVSGIIEAHVAKHAMEIKMEVIAEVIDAYEGRLSEIKGSRYFKEMADEGKMSNQEEVIKGLHEMAASIKEEYKKVHMPEEEVKEGKTIKVSQIKIADKGGVNNGFIEYLKQEDEIPVPPPLPPSVNDAIKAFLASDEDASNYGNSGSKFTAAFAELAKYVLNNKKLSKAEKGYYINQFNLQVQPKINGKPKMKGKPAPPPLPATAAKQGRVRAPKGTPPPPPPSK